MANKVFWAFTVHKFNKVNKMNTVYYCDPLAWHQSIVYLTCHSSMRMFINLYFYFSMEIQDVGKFSVNHYSVQTNIDLLDNVALCV